MLPLNSDRKSSRRDSNLTEWNPDLQPPPVYKDHFRLTFTILALGAILLLFNFFTFEKRGYHFEKPRNSKALDSTYRLARLTILTKCVSYVRNYFVDPQRIRPRRMLVAALKSVETKVAEVLVDVGYSGRRVTRLTLRVGSAKKSFDLTGVGDLYEMNWKFVDIFEFIEKNISSRVGLRKVEYIAVNGLLKTLDPHSTLLEPSTYAEIRRGTEGAFGGLGIVIALRDNQLTIVSVMEHTPAARAKLKPGDRIVQIGGESTVNMSLKEAAELLQGKPGSGVMIWIRRAGWKAKRKVAIVRSRIKIPSVIAKRLPGDIVHVQLKKFQMKTSRELKRLLREERKKEGGIKGLILDLRNNPGGLLDQSVQVADIFLKQGLIVTTVVHNNQVREVRQASRGESGEKIPLVVLINGSSASASEIVAGALKYNDRAIVLGRPSFGKDTVQVLYEIDENDTRPALSRTAALKLTIRRYLLAGKNSIQRVGLMPDIRIDSVSATKRRLRLFHSPTDKKTRPRTPNQIRHRLQVLRSPDNIDSMLDLATRLLKTNPHVKRSQFLTNIGPLLSSIQNAERLRITEKLQKLGVDWSDGKTSLLPTLRTELFFEPGANRLVGGRSVTLVARVRNVGRVPAYRLYGTTRSSNRLLDRLEFAFGLLKPGETKLWRVQVKLPASLVDRHDEIVMTLFDRTERRIAKRVLTATFSGLKRPKLAYRCSADDPQGNGDGLIQLGERVQLVCRIKNIGAGTSSTIVATIRNRSGVGVLLRRGRRKIEPLKPGESARARFRFSVNSAFRGRSLAFSIELADRSFRIYLRDGVSIPLFDSRPDPTLSPVRWLKVLSLSVPVHSGADTESPVLGNLHRGSLVRASLKLGNWYQVVLGNQKRGWLAGRGVRGAPIPRYPAPPVLTDEWLIGTPKIEVLAPRSQIFTRRPEVLIRGRFRAVGPDSSLHDLYVYQNSRKIFFQKADNPTAKGWVYWKLLLRLQPGQNRLIIVARQNEHLITGKHLNIYRKTGKVSP